MLASRRTQHRPRHEQRRQSRAQLAARPRLVRSSLPAKLSWPEKPRRSSTGVAGNVVIYQSACGRYRVTRSTSYGDGPWMAIVKRMSDTIRECWDHVDKGRRHYKTQHHAMAACQRHSDKRGGE